MAARYLQIREAELAQKTAKAFVQKNMRAKNGVWRSPNNKIIRSGYFFVAPLLRSDERKL